MEEMVLTGVRLAETWGVSCTTSLIHLKRGWNSLPLEALLRVATSPTSLTGGTTADPSAQAGW